MGAVALNCPFCIYIESYLLYNLYGDNMAEVIKIAISGGPCSGKTSCIEHIKSRYEQKGIDVFICPESATQIINAGVSRDDMHSFELEVANNQIKNEEELDNKISMSDSKKVLIIYDRGLTDCFAYVDHEMLFSNDLSINRIESWQRYDACMFLEESNEYESNDIRIESEKQANIYADKLLKSWMGHPHLRYINSFDNFDKKLDVLFSEIDSIVDDIEQEMKYLIEYPNLDLLSKYMPVEAEIEQVYLKSDIGSHRIRKRSINGTDTFFETIKIRITETLCTEIENIISVDEYNKLLSLAKTDRDPIIKKRYCFLYKGQYFEMDVFPFWNDKALLELEIRSDDQKIEIPPEINVIKDVSNDSRYKNNSLAKLIHKKRLKNENS